MKAIALSTVLVTLCSATLASAQELPEFPKPQEEHESRGGRGPSQEIHGAPEERLPDGVFVGVGLEHVHGEHAEHGEAAGEVKMGQA